MTAVCAVDEMVSVTRAKPSRQLVGGLPRPARQRAEVGVERQPFQATPAGSGLDRTGIRRGILRLSNRRLHRKVIDGQMPNPQSPDDRRCRTPELGPVRESLSFLHGFPSFRGAVVKAPKDGLRRRAARERRNATWSCG